MTRLSLLLWLVLAGNAAAQYVVPAVPVAPAVVPVVPVVPVIPQVVAPVIPVAPVAVPVVAPVWGFVRGPLGAWRMRRVYPVAVAVPVAKCCK